MNAIAGKPDNAIAAIQHVAGYPHVRAASAKDAIDGFATSWIVEPGTPAELAQALSLANSAGLHVIPRGGGTKIDWGNPPTGADIVLSTKRLDRILEHASGDMTATVQAGCTVAAFNQALARRGQRLALDPLWPQQATIGGILATDDSGPLRAAFGTLRDHLIGITVALADGTVARSGGKVVKNVAGYDLPKLFTGSFGTLGVITEATFRLYPLARSSVTLRFVAPTFDVLDQALSALTACSLVTAAVQIETDENGEAQVMVLVEGLPEAIAGKVRRVVGAVTDCGAHQIDPPADAWNAMERLFFDPDSCVAKVSLLPTQWPTFLARAREQAMQSGAQCQIIAQAVGVGLLRLAPSPLYSGERVGVRGEAAKTGEYREGTEKTAIIVPNAPCGARPLTPALSPEYRGEGAGAAQSFAPRGTDQSSPDVDVVRSLRTHLQQTGGSLVLLRCPPNVKRRIDVWPDVGNALLLMQRIKNQFDPNRILSPGRFVGGI
jgi:glycolate oxidase FAD binding subunit